MQKHGYYVEDYLSGDVIDTLDELLDNFDKDEAFHLAIFSLLKSDDDGSRLIKYINDNKKATTKDVVLFALKIHRGLI